MKRNGSLNRIYRLVWNHVVNAWVAVAEIGTRTGKSTSAARSVRRSVTALLAGLAVLPTMAHAGPTGGHVTSGSAQISQNGQTTTIDQTSSSVSISWQSFNVGAQQTVDFVQPNSSSVAVNRIYSSDGTTILGHVNANGQIFLIDPNGIIFGPGAQVNVGGLVASALELNGSADSDVMTFSQAGSSGGKVTNLGTITAANGGYVALLGQQVLNGGSISARLGTVALGAGSQATLTFAGNQLLHLSIDQSTLNSLAENRQLIEADGGQVIMTAGAKNSVLASVVNNSGVIEARTVDDHAGVITLLGGMQAGSVNVGGRLDASAPNGGDGGAIETSGARVKVGDGAVVDTHASSGKTGSWLIDPTDYNIAASGGDITGATLSGELASTNVVIKSSSGSSGTAGNVNVQDAVSWSANTTLTLQASNSVNVDAPITATGNTAGLVLSPGTGTFNLNDGASVTLSGATPSLQIAGLNYVVINSVGVAGDTSNKTLQGIHSAALNFALGSNIDATSTATWNSGAGFSPISNLGGNFNGLGHTISNLSITPTTAGGGAALFGNAFGTAEISNLGLVNETVTNPASGSGSTAGLLALSNSSGVVIYNDYVTGKITGDQNVGALVGITASGQSISNSWSSAQVTGSQLVGGLVGDDVGAVISNSYSSGSVTQVANGLSATQLNNQLGGLVGAASKGSTLTNVYAIGAVTPVAGASAGGLVGSIDSTMPTASNAYWNVASTGQSTSALGTPLTAAQSTAQASYAGFDFTSANPIWVIYAGDTTPLLASFLKPLTITANSSSVVYNGATQSASTAGVTYSDPSAATSNQFNVDYNDGKDVTSVSSIYSVASNQLGYNITLVNGTFTITAKPVTVSATGISKVYDGGTADPVALTVNGVIGTDAVTAVDSAAAFSTKDVGNGKLVTVTGIALGGAAAFDYALSNGTTTTSANITPLALTVTATGSNKVYDGSAAASATIADSGVLAGDVVTLTDTGASYSDKNVGNGKTITVSGITASGAQAADYSFSTTAVTTGNITPKTLNVTATGIDKVYNGNTGASVTLADSGLVAGDTVALNDTSATFASKDVGTGKAVTVAGITATGVDAGNYAVNATAMTTASITPKSISVAATGTNKTYDGSAADAVSLAAAGEVAGDNLTFTDTSATFASKNVGANLPVTVAGIALGGTDAGDYTLTNTGTTTTATISAKPVTLVVAGNDKVYDGSTAASVTVSDPGVIAGDVINLAYAGAAFNDKNAGNGKTITLNSVSATGADAANYVFSAPLTTTGDITPKALVLSETGTDKVYNGNTGATVSLVDSGVVTGDNVVLNDTSATFASKDVGTAKTITVNGINLSGADATDYTVASSITTTASITPKAISATVTGTNKTYDGSVADAVTLTPTGIIAGDAVSLTDSSATFADKNVGNGKTVTVAGLALSGAASGDYALASTSATTSASITPKSISVTATGADKTYDGSTADTVLLAAAGIVAGDVVNLGDSSATFADKNVGSSKTVSVAGIDLSGADAGNYTLSNTSAVTSASITPKTLSVTATGRSKTYDGTTTDTVALTDAGVVAGDSVTVTDGAATFADKNVGSGKTVTVSGLAIGGQDASNYALGATSLVTVANITPATLTYVATPATGTRGQSLPTLTGTITGFVAGDTLANATSGSADWTTPATSSSAAGQYAIDGSGVTATNYVLQQGAGNATALTLKAASAPGPAPAPSPTPAPAPVASTAVETDGAVTATTVAQACSTGSSANGGQQEEGGCHPAAKVNPPTSPALHVIDGGLKLPPQLLSAR